MSKSKIPLDVAEDKARAFIATLQLKKDFEIVGSIRRKERFVGDIDILIEDQLFLLKPPGTIKMRGASQMTVIVEGIQFNLFKAEKRNWGAMRLTYTGPKEYNIFCRAKAKNKGYKLNQYGLWDQQDKLLASQTEDDILKLLGIDWMLPEVRHEQAH